MADRFGSSKKDQLYRATLRSRTRKRDETLPELAQDIRRLVRLAYPGGGEVLRALETDGFISAIADRKLREVVFASAPQNMDAALDVAVRMEGYYRWEGPQRSNAQIRELTEEAEDVELSRLRDTKGIRKCFGCGEIGHFRKECPTNPYPDIITGKTSEVARSGNDVGTQVTPDLCSYRNEGRM